MGLVDAAETAAASCPCIAGARLRPAVIRHDLSRAAPAVLTLAVAVGGVDQRVVPVAAAAASAAAAAAAVAVASSLPLLPSARRRLHASPAHFPPAASGRRATVTGRIPSSCPLWMLNRRFQVRDGELVSVV